MTEIDWKALRAPFAPDEIKWRVQRKKKDGAKAAWIPYVDARVIQDRLDNVVGIENWKNEYAPGGDGGVLCGLSIRIGDEWLTKWDGAENTQIEAVKGGISDAFKRAAVVFGIGRYLYGADEIWTAIDEYGNCTEKHLLVLKFGGKPFYPQASGQSGGSTQPERKPANVVTLPQPAQPAGEQTSGGKIERPMTPIVLIDSLQRKAISFDKPAHKLVASKTQLAAYHARMKEWIGDIPRKYIQQQAFGVEHSTEMTSGEIQTMLSWLPSRETLAGVPETIVLIEQEIAAVEIEAMAAAEQQAARVEA